uniref:MHC class I-like antigen recognition-like domain-containing protein n=1 Tax=Oryzias latipes TaxID=8090 RepID=A0A3P9JJB7_ORYLA
MITRLLCHTIAPARLLLAPPQSSLIMYAGIWATVTHSLRYLHTAASGIPAFPEFVTVVQVDGQPFSYYDSSIRRELPRQTWTVQTEDPNFWERRTKSSIVDKQVFKTIRRPKQEDGWKNPGRSRPPRGPGQQLEMASMAL